jgi:hypothetical protein
MNNILTYFTVLIISLPIIGCRGGKTPYPDQPDQLENKTLQTDILNIFADSVEIAQTEHFFKLEKSVEDVQKEIEVLRTRVMKYEHKYPEPNYTKQLKELINKPPPAHKISFKNGSIIKGTIEKDKLDYLLVDTNVGKLTINKSDIENIDDLILPTPDVVFIGHGQEEVFETYRLFTGKVINQGSRRGDFVRVIYNLWGEDTQLIRSDSSFVEGTQIIYRSGIVTDTVLEPNQSAQFRVEIPLSDSIQAAYVTRDVRWELFD